jgi:hypothetical protein
VVFEMGYKNPNIHVNILHGQPLKILFLEETLKLNENRFHEILSVNKDGVSQLTVN